jgi:hypothetical protein
MALTCYCDDSGTHRESTYAVVSGIVMKKDGFLGLCEDWSEILREFRIEKIHMTDFVRPFGRYCSMPSEMKIALFTSVAKIILERKSYSISSAVSQRDFDDFVPIEAAREFMGALRGRVCVASDCERYGWA